MKRPAGAEPGTLSLSMAHGRLRIDLRPGGVFRTVMRSPEGEEHPNFGCYLELVPNRKLVWTDALEAGFRPSRHPAHDGFRFRAAISLEPQGKATKYTAVAMHGDETARRKHDEMGFQDGWGTALDQLVASMKSAGTRAGSCGAAAVLAGGCATVDTASGTGKRPRRCRSARCARALAPARLRPLQSPASPP
jgi:uncharacterized protein YndB with AHSA1/START domain